MSTMSRISEAIFGLVAFVAVGCFVALIVLQVLEWKFYQEDPRLGGNIWPLVILPAATQPLQK